MSAEASATNVPDGRLLLVSPHLDDAALSCGALIERPGKIGVLTVCTGQPNPARRGSWDEVTGFEDSAQSMNIGLGDTVSITIMEAIDNAFVAAVPGLRSAQRSWSIEPTSGAARDAAPVRA